jgi:hypothetical protein
MSDENWAPDPTFTQDSDGHVIMQWPHDAQRTAICSREFLEAYVENWNELVDLRKRLSDGAL